MQANYLLGVIPLPAAGTVEKKIDKLIVTAARWSIFKLA